MSSGSHPRPERRPALLAATPLLFGLLSLGVLAWAATYDGPADAAPAPGDLGVIRHLLHHSLGLSAARPERPLVRIDGRGFQPGDILLASRSGSAYGHFSHVTAFVGDGEVAGHNVLFGIFTMPAQDMTSYDHVRIVRPRVDDATRARAAARIRALSGTVFNLLAIKHDPTRWHCAKSVWAGYAREGLDLAPGRSFVVPDDIAASPQVELVREWGAP